MCKIFHDDEMCKNKAILLNFVEKWKIIVRKKLRRTFDEQEPSTKRKSGSGWPKGPFIATQLNSTQLNWTSSWVELRRYKRALRMRARLTTSRTWSAPTESALVICTNIMIVVLKIW